MVAIFSFLAPVVGEGLGFLRILRPLRLLHTYQLVARLRADSPFYRRNEEAIIAVVNLGVFLFIMTGVVYEFSIGAIQRSPTMLMRFISRYQR